MVIKTHEHTVYRISEVQYLPEGAGVAAGAGGRVYGSPHCGAGADGGRAARVVAGKRAAAEEVF